MQLGHKQERLLAVIADSLHFIDPLFAQRIDEILDEGEVSIEEWEDICKWVVSESNPTPPARWRRRASWNNA